MKTFSASDIKTVWQAYKSGIRSSQIREMMGYTQAEFNECFQQARQEYEPFKRVTKETMPRPKKDIIKAAVPEPKQHFIRPRAEYSNRSPYGIARPGIVRK